MEKVGASRQFIVLEYSVGGSGQFVLSMGFLNDRKIALYGAKNIKGDEGVYFNELQLLVESLIKKSFEVEKINTYRFNKATVVVDKKGDISLKVRDVKGLEKDVAIANDEVLEDIKGLLGSILGDETRKKDTDKAEKRSVSVPITVPGNKKLLQESHLKKQESIESLRLKKAEVALAERSSKKTDKAESAKKEEARREKKERILRRIIKEEIVDKAIEDESLKKKEKKQK